MTSTLTTTQKEKQVRVQRHSARMSLWNQLAKSILVLSCITLIAFDIAARIFFHPDRYSSTNRSWISWIVKDFRHNKVPADFALFGSSLVLAGQNGADALFTNTGFDATTHHEPQYLDHLLKAKTSMPVHSFSFAIGGQMASDVFAIASTLFSKNNQPNVVLWGIAPRDFLDATFGYPSDTETVRYMNKIADAEVLGESKPFWQRVEHLLGQLSYIYAKRQDFIYAQQEFYKSILSAIGPMSDMEHIRAPAKLLKIAMITLPEDVAPGQHMVQPHEIIREIYTDNSVEYRQRYNPFKLRTLKQQMGYLEKFLLFARSRGIRVCLVNMPLTEDNMKLMPLSSYDLYLASVGNLASKYNATFWDFNKKGMFSKSEFFDPVHLSGTGGMKLFRLIADKCEHESICSLRSP